MNTAAESLASLVHLELRRGIPSLAAIAATAPFCGLLGACDAMHEALMAHAGMDTVILLLSESLAWVAWGLVLAVVAQLGHRHLSRKLTQCETEMAPAIGQPARYSLTKDHGQRFPHTDVWGLSSAFQCEDKA